MKHHKHYKPWHKYSQRGFHISLKEQNPSAISRLRELFFGEVKIKEPKP